MNLSGTPSFYLMEYDVNKSCHILSQACRLEDSLESIWIYGLRTNIR
jgi:hypothetical protein